MLKFSKDDAISLREAAEVLPGNPSPATLSRWAHHGVRGTRLATVLVGGRRYTTPAAINTFLGALSDPCPQGGPSDTA